MVDQSPSLDFIVIGAPKAGTTSLFEYLRTHPQIHLPKWKETNFFLDPLYNRGVQWYLDWVLAGASGDVVCGEASVRCMAGTPNATPPGDHLSPPAAELIDDPEKIIPERIHAALP